MSQQPDASSPHYRRQFLGSLLGAGGAAVVSWPRATVAAPIEKTGYAVNVRDFGAVGNGSTLDTISLQKAIDICSQSGGGTVLLPAGTYLSGSLVLRSQVTLHLANGAILLGSPNLQDYRVTIPKLRSYTDNYTERSLLFGEDLRHVVIEGQGVIDGQGAKFKGPYKVRPYLLRLSGSRDVSVKGVTFKDSPMWVQHYLGCERVNIDGVQVESRCNYNNDGIDIDGCQQVRIANCDISSGDDAIVLKSTLGRACKDVVINNCILSSTCNAFKLGTESNGGFDNIMLSNCTMHETALAGIAVECVDGGTLQRVNISNVTMRNVKCPIFIRLGNRARPYAAGMPKPGQGSLRGVSISQVQAVGADHIGCSITGLPDAPVEDIWLSDIRIAFSGDGKSNEPVKSVPEHPEKYPEYSMFGPLPAYGFYCRHARHVQFDDVQLETLVPDFRPAMVLDDIEDLEIFRLAGCAGKAPWMLQVQDLRNALLHGCRCPDQVKTFLRVDGKNTRSIQLHANMLRDGMQAVQTGDDVGKESVIYR